MGLLDFGKKECKPLEAVLFSLQMNMSNNYKDATISDMNKLETLYETLRKSGELTEKQMIYYAGIIDEWREKTKGFGYKNQKIEKISRLSLTAFFFIAFSSIII